MGEQTRVCAVDSHGKLFGFDNVWLSDASIIPDAPGVNPQGTVMALAYRNALAFLRERSGRGVASSAGTRGSSKRLGHSDGRADVFRSRVDS